MREEKILSTCLMDSDAEAKSRRRATRRKAIIVAIAFEAVLLAWLLLWPILTPGSPPGELVMLPRIPFPRTEAPSVHAAPQPAENRASSMFRNPIFIFEPARIPPRILMNPSVPPANVALPDIGNGPQGSPQGISGIPDGLEKGSWTIPPPQPKPPRIIQSSEGVQAGMLIHRVDPQYPAIARIAHVSGTVELRAIIAHDGTVRSVEVLSGSPILARAAERAVWQWRFRPTLLDGEAVEVETRITVRFVLGP